MKKIPNSLPPPPPPRLKACQSTSCRMLCICGQFDFTLILMLLLVGSLHQNVSLLCEQDAALPQCASDQWVNPPLKFISMDLLRAWEARPPFVLPFLGPTLEGVVQDVPYGHPH